MTKKGMKGDMMETKKYWLLKMNGLLPMHYARR
jgi:hypothetical protein